MALSPPFEDEKEKEKGFTALFLVSI